MSDETPAGTAPKSNNGSEAVAAEPTTPALVVNAQYIKDLSFEAPATPAVFGLLQRQQPNIGLNINVTATPMQQNMFEVVLNIKAECKTGETVCFILELDYGGLFTLNVEDQYRQAVLLIECPRMLFPFARHLVSVISRDGGFPPVMIGPIDFVALYQQRLQEVRAQQPAGGPATA